MIDGQARADRAFEALAGRVEPRRLFVTGRIEVLGKHTDYAGGRSLTWQDVPLERHPHFPRPAEGLRIFNRRFVPQVIRPLRRVALDDL